MPQKIKIGHFSYDLQIIDDLENEGVDLFGRCEALEQVIKLRSGLSEERHKNTLWHEVLHGVEDVYGVSFGEAKVSLLASVIVQLLQDNPILRVE